MQNPNLVVDPLDQSKTDFVLRMTIGGNAIPMGFNQLGELPIRLQSLPFQVVFPTLEEGPRAAFGAVVPELSEAFLEDVGGVQAPVGLQQFLQRSLPIQTQVLGDRESKV